MSKLRRALKPWMLPLAMVCGALLHQWMHYVQPLSRVLIFVMLLITYCRVPLASFRPGRLTWQLLAVQLGGSLAVYAALLPVSPLLAQGVFICVFCPTATAAPVVTGMLGGDVGQVAVYSLLSHVSVALTAPLLLQEMCPSATGLSLWAGVAKIATEVLPLILGPLAVALILEARMPRLHRLVASHQGLAFYIWALALLIVVGNAVAFVIAEGPGLAAAEGALAGVALAACIAQFAIGRALGRRQGSSVAGAQALGQKNTVLGIWLALTFLNPLTAVAPAAYVAWHNIANTLQLWRHGRAQASGDGC